MLTRPLRVMHVIETLRPGGAEQLVLTTVRHLDRARFEPSVAALSPPLDLREDMERLGVLVDVLGVRRRLDVCPAALRLAAALRARRVDILHTHMFYAHAVGRAAAALARVPVVVSSLHHPDYSDQDTGRWTFKLRKGIDRLTARAINHGFVAVSRAVAEDYRHHFRLRQIDVIHNYVDPAAFTPASAEQRDKMRAAFLLGQGDFVIVHVARLQREKGQRYLVEAMPAVCREVPSARLVLVGEGPDEELLRGMADRLGLRPAVVFAGQRRDVREVLAMADVFAFPSVFEGLGIALLEAMAMGLPVVASRVEGIPEVVTDGVDGLLVPRQQSAELARAIIRLHKDPALRRQTGHAAQRTVRERFAVAVGLPRLEDLYTRLAGERRKETAT